MRNLIIFVAVLGFACGMPSRVSHHSCLEPQATLSPAELAMQISEAEDFINQMQQLPNEQGRPGSNPDDDGHYNYVYIEG